MVCRWLAFPLSGNGGGNLSLVILGLSAVVVATVVFRLSGLLLRGKGAGPARDRSLDILKTRLAQGAITEQEYLHLRGLLGK